MTQKETFSDIINGPVPVLVDFYADWCGPCKMMKPILQELHGMMGDRLRIIKIDTDRNAAVSQQYQISGIPTLILFKNCRVLWRQSGVMPARQLQQVIMPHL
jgi:thioredoxin 1